MNIRLPLQVKRILNMDNICNDSTEIGSYVLVLLEIIS